MLVRLRRVSARRYVVAACLLVAAISTIYVLYRPSLSPLGLHSRQLSIGTASAEVMVAAPNLQVGTEDQYLTQVNHAILLGDLMATPAVLDAVGRKLDINPNDIQATAPVTAMVPRVVGEPGSGEAAQNLALSNDDYKIEVQADPSVPLLHVYTEAPTTAGAERLASAAVQGLVTYLGSTQSLRRPTAAEVGVQQLGAPLGGTANSGASKEMAVLVFVGVFAVALWLAFLGERVLRGWGAAHAETAALADR